MRAHLPLAALAALALPALASPPTDPTFSRERGRCAIRDSCGRKSTFGGEIPCPDNALATPHDDDQAYTSLLAQVCGEDFVTTTCCTAGQLETLQASLAQAEPLIASCPACRLNFRRFYCHFTCSPDQSTFLTVTATQTLTKDGEPREAVKEVEFSVAEEFGMGFFESCRNVKFGATNSYAMDFIGGGATDYLAFLRYMGQERSLGSPFQISFPSPSPSSPSALALDPPTPLTTRLASCSSPDLSERCACPDCPSVCAALPPRLSPRERASRRCRVGRMDCLPFALVVGYAVALCAAVTLLAAREARTRWTLAKGDGGEGVGEGQGAIRLEEDDDGGEGEEGGMSPGLRTWTRLRHRLSFGGWSTRGPSGTGTEDEPSSTATPARSRSGTRTSGGTGLVGARSLAGELDGGAGGGDESTSSRSQSQRPSSHGASLSLSSDPLSHPFSGSADPALQPRVYALNTRLTALSYRLGLLCARHPWATLALGFVLCALANLGWARFEVETEPVRLWVPPGSDVAREKAAFEGAFGPFYRTEQAFFSVAPEEGKEWDPEDTTPVLSWETLQFLASVEDDIRSLSSPTSNLTLRDVCFAPTSSSSPPASVGECVVQSPLGYFANDLSPLDPSTWANALDACAASPATCLPPFGQPLNPKLVLSLPPPSSADGEKQPAHKARAVILTYVLSASLDSAATARAEDWERTLGAYLSALASPGGAAAARGLRVSYSTGVSLEAELGSATNSDVPVVVGSYVAMFAYVALALGGAGGGVVRLAGRAVAAVVRSAVRRVKGEGAIKLGAGRVGREVGRRMLVEGKVGLALFGILIVLLSVSTSVAICSFAGVKVTLVIAEVIPFLVLAIGVDNVFLLLHTLSQQNALAYAASTRHLTSTGLLDADPTSSLDLHGPDATDDEDDDVPPPSERVARALARMGPSILLSASCEAVAFGLGALVGMPAVRNFAIYAAGAVLVNTALQVTMFVAAMALDLRRVEANRVDCFPFIKLPSASSTTVHPAPAREGYLARFIRTIYAPILLNRWVKYFVLALFSGGFVLSWIGVRHVELGLDQRLALPSSSYLVDYFNALDSYLDVGPPVYFVAEGLNLTALDEVKLVCGRFTTCDAFSLANVLEAERKRPESSYIAEPPAVWLDDFISWTNPALEDCCRVKRRNPAEFCGPTDSEFACKPCFEDREWSPTLDGFPEDGEFMRYLRQWLISPADESCPLGGKAAYSSALALSSAADAGASADGVELSHFRTYHTPLTTQSDFIEALAAARRISQDLERRTGATVFPYSVFYVFFQSYATIWSTTREVLTFALSAVFLLSSLLLGSFRTGAVVALTTFLALFAVLGGMGAFGISLNPLSLVNLCVSVGIAVEFSAHVARAFVGAQGGGVPCRHPAAKRDRDERAAAALEEVGASVLSGIGATKLIGIAVLFATKSQLLKLYYARLWLILIVSSALHGLVFLPVALSLFGGQGYALTAEDGDGWIATSVQRRYERENHPFLDDDASDESDEF
ncbi:hypothetical protein JCM10207_005259 [Rhodosporidiobolus poonsookiae]